MSAIIKEREKIQDTLNNKVDSSEAKEWYKSLFNAVFQSGISKHIELMK